MSITTSRGVPGTPLGALDAVSDENARLVLQSIVDGMNVRNGFSGAGDMAFVTRSELSSSQSTLSLGLSRRIESYTDQIRKITPGQIIAAINDLQAQIMESKLFKDLGERVDLIDKPGGIFDRLQAAELVLIQETNQRIEGDTALSARLDVMGTRVGTAEAVISTETTQRVNADNAIQQTITTQYSSVNNNLALLQSQQTTTANNVAAMTSTMQQIQAQVGANAAAITQEQQVRADADGTLYAQWTLRVDVAGRVSGFGLASNATVSDFIVRADRFSIASPSTQDGIQPQIPFIVKTTGSNVGVYIKSAFIEDASITRAKIGDAEVDTLKIAGNAVTVPTTSRGGAYSGNGVSNFSIINESWIRLDQPGFIYAHCLASQWYGTGIRTWNMKIEISNDWGMIVGGDSVTVSPSISISKYKPAGDYYIRVWWAGQDSGVRVQESEMFVMGAKR